MKMLMNKGEISIFQNKFFSIRIIQQLEVITNQTKNYYFC